MIGKKFNYGWVIVGYGVLCMLLLHYGTVGSQAIFLLPVTQDLGVSTTTLTMASTYGTIVKYRPYLQLPGKVPQLLVGNSLVVLVAKSWSEVPFELR